MNEAPQPVADAPLVTSNTKPYDYDVTIVGAGPVGLALAGWLARRSATRKLSVALIDAREPEDSIADPRAIAVSQGSRMILEPLSWPSDATAIQRIHVSQRGHFGRTLIDHAEHGLPALGYVLRYGSIVHALADAVRATPVHWFKSTRAQAPQQLEDDGVLLPIESAHVTRTLRTRVLVSAEGGLFGEQQAGSGETRDYGQTALVGTVTLSSPQPHVAWERFTSQGPIALLPTGGVRGADYALVWCCAPHEAARRAQLSDEDFLRELGVEFGDRMGRFVQIKGRAAFPLGLNTVDTLVKGNVVAIGNAAQTLHPVAGQGLNLGLRDAHALADALSHHGATRTALIAFAQRRAFDRRMTIGATDTLARLFTIDFPPLATLRGLALTALEFVPPLKTALARQMIFGQRR
ncbi:UbiH/UbiF/VisC/COQ6 family ubiquinone biosynthesis hydroxylase [Paraburkholderia phymatum]|uniref:Ubiquinone biosynthesis hydroxylase, UbiH/UbiF/VisC/COQ6 family n=1 Tax=Paraburkholderia phymatum (strain DSM 17167 / CIP 108236 / LMG 21445 / STM815) TaxID=391038 RepID=B2JGT8_PARP8|nr:UbiH/UbiF/VisC/COQ6 family ubiquinone biosynthesis hydroxylase [Paraburkholderia phymatum]ACC71722.1 Ubiquinone biosynthesis hydroxylase, UbiH/UbiF/VisC/COQ6 family [Paraburkholderia phymatum STM815]